MVGQTNNNPQQQYNSTSKPSKPFLSRMATFPSPLKKSSLYSLALLLLLCTFSYLFGLRQHGGEGVARAFSAATSTSTANNILTIPCNNPTTTTTKVLTKDLNNKQLDFSSHHVAEGGAATLETSTKAFPPCNVNFSEYTPCEDDRRSLKYSRRQLIYRERHCPMKDELVKCRIPAPYGYRNPFKWPASRDYAWYANVPHKHLTVEKAVQNWIQYKGDRFKFPGGGTGFPNGADAYIDEIGKLINLRDGSIRTAIDTGCGVASWGAYLLSRNVLTMSFAPRDTHEAQVQFALERGVPAMIGVMASIRTPYPSRAFDMAHCSRCLIPWTDLVSWPSGASFEGEFRSRRMEGFGTFIGADGDTYRESWSGDRKHGFGQKRYANGDLYEGSWQKNLQDGKGRYVWRNRNKYVGEWRFGVISGKGVLVWANGKWYERFWENRVPKDRGGGGSFLAKEFEVEVEGGEAGGRKRMSSARGGQSNREDRGGLNFKNKGGLYLMEVDRVLRPGGYWILSGPPIRWKRYWKGWDRTKEDLNEEQTKIENLAKSLCWKKLVERDDIAIWQKPINHFYCKPNRKIAQNPSLCPSHQDPDKAWYTKMETCLTQLPDVSDGEEVAGGKLERWPARLTAIPPRISSGSVQGVTSETFRKDLATWKRRISYYKTVNNQLGQAGRYRNLLDMNAYLGGFAAALVDDPVWVMNVVPDRAKVNTLGVIYERGLIGTYQNWCEAMSTYPRTYDLIHADSLFSLYDGRCNPEDVLLEMDRILRPEGSVIIRDDVDILVKIKKITDGLNWDSQIVDHEDGPLVREKLLFAVKSYWTAPSVQDGSVS